MVKKVVSTLLLSFLSVVCFGASNSFEELGFHPDRLYSSESLGGANVNILNGNLTIQQPAFPSIPSDGSISISASMSYNSSGLWKKMITNYQYYSWVSAFLSRPGAFGQGWDLITARLKPLHDQWWLAADCLHYEFDIVSYTDSSGASHDVFVKYDDNEDFEGVSIDNTFFKISGHCVTEGTTDLKAYNLPRECSCGGFGCPMCQVSLTCEVANTTNMPLDIYSGDLKSNDPKIIPVDPRIPIVKIDKNDKVIIEAYAILGIAKKHVKWQAVSNIFYRFYPIIDFDDTKCTKCSDKCIVSRMCPEKLYNFSEKKTPKLVEDYWKSCTLCNSCQETCPEAAIKVSWKDDTYIFSIESDGVLPFNILIEKVFEIFFGKIDEFIERLGDIEIES